MNNFTNKNKMKLIYLILSISMCIMGIVLNILIENKIVSIIFGFIGLLFICISLLVFVFTDSVRIFGVPNNSAKKFISLQYLLNKKDLIFEEIEKGIWEFSINGKISIIDMRKWRRQTKKIYELLFFFTYIELYNNQNIKNRGLFRKIKITKIDNYQITFKPLNKNEKKKNLIRNNVLRRNFVIQIKLFNCIPMKGPFIDYKYLFRFKKQDINAFYKLLK